MDTHARQILESFEPSPYTWRFLPPSSHCTSRQHQLSFAIPVQQHGEHPRTLSNACMHFIHLEAASKSTSVVTPRTAAARAAVAIDSDHRRSQKGYRRVWICVGYLFSFGFTPRSAAFCRRRQRQACRGAAALLLCSPSFLSHWQAGPIALEAEDHH